MLTVYGLAASGNCWKVRQLLELTGTPFAWKETDSNAGQTRTPEFLRKNPNGKVPTVELDDGTFLHESNALLLHFAEGTRYLPPAGTLERARAYEWLFFEQYSHEPYIAVARNVIAYRKEKAAWADRLPALMERGYHALGVMNQRLGEVPFFVGDSLSVADLALFAYTHVAHEGEFELARFAALQAWLDRVRAFPGMRPLA